MIGGPVPARLDAAIHAAIDTFPAGSLQVVASKSGTDPNGLPLVIKYVPTQWGASYLSAGGQLKISTTPGFTWGTGTYVAPLAFPLSSMIFGRIGVVAAFDPTAWRVFDATLPTNQALYLAWLQRQPIYRLAAMTAHSAYYNQFLRDEFRIRYHIDSVLFRPDQHSAGYTSSSDVWMAVTDWRPDGTITTGDSARFVDPRLTVLAEEEFEDQLYGVYRRPLLQLTTGRPPGLTAQIAAAYAARKIVRVSA